MRPCCLIPATAALFILTAAVPALGASCADELARLDEEIGVDRHGRGNREIRTLHEAAMIFSRNGQDDACESVAAGIREYLRAGAAGGSAAVPQADFAQRLASARPLAETEGAIRVSDLIGADVVSGKGEKLGDVDDVVMSPSGDTRYLLVGTGGFLELGEKFVPVRSDEVRVLDRNTLVLDVPETAFKDAPRFDMETIQSKTEQWSDSIAAWWKTNVTDRVN